jgi:hypothetical protein
MTLNDFFRYLATDQRTRSLSDQLADAYRLQTPTGAKPKSNLVRPR